MRVGHNYYNQPLTINDNHYNFQENKCIPFSLSNAVTNSSILENPQFCREEVLNNYVW